MGRQRSAIDTIVLSWPKTLIQTKITSSVRKHTSGGFGNSAWINGLAANESSDGGEKSD